ncbi:MAG: 8-amino-7-oxononanoate synthase [Planctomycetes bacterium]|nr:8-amino-7-oxononanoate synthase [Planctomycetota bacterium]
MSLTDRWTGQLEELRRLGRFRGLTPPRGIDFSSNDYLGYRNLPLPPEAELPRTGTASRLLRGHHVVWDEVESKLAQWHGAEAALMFSSGYTANEGLLSTVIEPGDCVASDEFNHASIIDGLKLAKAERFIFRHNDLNHLEEGLREASQARPPQRQLFLVTESLYGMEGDFVAPEIAGLVKKYEVNWIVDEAHTTGCLGRTGAGFVDHKGWRDQVLATVHTGGKALGVHGAYVACSRLLRDILVNRCRHFIFTTALPPRVGTWWLDVLGWVEADKLARRKIHENASHFHAALERHGVKSSARSYIVSIVLGEDASATNAAKALQEAGFDIRAIRPPTVPEGTARLRVSIHADHDDQTLDSAAEAIGRVLHP